MLQQTTIKQKKKTKNLKNHNEIIDIEFKPLNSLPGRKRKIEIESKETNGNNQD